MSNTEGNTEAGSSKQSDGYEQRIVALIQAAGTKGINDADIKKEMPELSTEQRVTIVNKLIAQGLLDLFNVSGALVYKLKDPSKSNDKLKGADNEERIVYAIIEEAGNKGIWMRDIRYKSNLMPTMLAKILKQLEGKKMIKAVKSVAGLLDLFNVSGALVYKLKDPSKSNDKLKGADNEERIVYAIIEEAGNKGIWMRDIRYKSNLMPTMLAKILKQLEGKKMMKAVKSVAASKKKVYMLYNLEPDRSLTGGAWYCDQDFEAEFVDVLNQQCYRYLQQRKEKTIPIAAKSGPLAALTMAYATSKDVWKFITELGISKVQLSEEDIKTILDTLLYDGKVERSLNVDGEYLYRAVESLLPPPGIVRVPCGVCPCLVML